MTRSLSARTAGASVSRVVRYHRYGGPEVLTLDEVPAPQPGPGQVRVRVRAAGVNAIDWKRRRGLFAHGEPLREPAGTGIELSGTIDAVGPATPGWRVGQDVLGRVPTGAAATHALADPDSLLAKPDWLAFEQAAALPVAAETAVRTLRQLAVRAGQTLLVHAVAGGVGVLAAQLARARGVAVVGTASPSHHAVLRELGVEPVAYGDGLADRVRAAAPGGIDAVLDAAGRGALAVSIELAGGADKVITIADPQAASYGVRFSAGTQGVGLREVFAEILPLLERGEVRMPIERIFPLHQAADAHRLSEDGHLLGKIVLAVA
jgi:NADPH:quinone reductase-like Zn-dependent oxidoreductase